MRICLIRSMVLILTVFALAACIEPEDKIPPEKITLEKIGTKIGDVVDKVE